MHDAWPKLIWFFRRLPIGALTIVLVAALFAVIATIFASPAQALSIFPERAGSFRRRA